MVNYFMYNIFDLLSLVVRKTNNNTKKIIIFMRINGCFYPKGARKPNEFRNSCVYSE